MKRIATVFIGILFAVGSVACSDQIEVKAKLIEGNWWGMHRKGKKGLQFHPRNLFNNKKKNAWCIAGEAGGFIMTFDQDVTITGMQIMNGWAKNKKSLKSNLQAKKFFLLGDWITVKQNKGSRLQKIKLKKEFVLEKGKPFKVKLARVYKRKGVSDVCITQMGFTGKGLFGDKPLKIILPKKKPPLEIPQRVGIWGPGDTQEVNYSLCKGGKVRRDFGPHNEAYGLGRWKVVNGRMRINLNKSCSAECLSYNDNPVPTCDKWGKMNCSPDGETHNLDQKTTALLFYSGMSDIDWKNLWLANDPSFRSFLTGEGYVMRKEPKCK